MNTLLAAQLLKRDRRRRNAGTAHADVIVEHPDLDGSAAQIVITVRHRVHQGFLPCKCRVFEPLTEKKIVENGPLANVFFDASHGFVDQAHERRFEANTLDTLSELP